VKEPKPSARLLWARLRRARHAGLPALAILRARALLAEVPDCGPVWCMLGSELASLARYEEAEQALRKAIEHSRSDKLRIPYAEMGRLFEATGEYDQAEVWYRRSIEAAPDAAGGYIQLGGVLARLGRADEAEAAYRRATRCGSGCIEEAYLNLGLALCARERFGEAAVCIEESLRLDADYREARRARKNVTACLRELERSK
jgi:tetratricopeptide (TPR) repeat protein